MFTYYYCTFLALSEHQTQGFKRLCKYQSCIFSFRIYCKFYFPLEILFTIIYLKLIWTKLGCDHWQMIFRLNTFKRLQYVLFYISTTVLQGFLSPSSGHHFQCEGFPPGRITCWRSFSISGFRLLWDIESADKPDVAATSGRTLLSPAMKGRQMIWN